MLAANLLCRLPDPDAFLRRLGGRDGLVKPGGVVYLVSPYSWMPQYTPREAWLGGRAGDAEGGSAARVAARMRELGFALEAERAEPLVIRDHARKFQFIVSHGMLFRRDDDA